MSKHRFPHNFKSRLYRIGINLVVDVPKKITAEIQRKKGPIRIVGTINESEFHTTLMPVKDLPYILYVNIPMLKAAGIGEGDTATFSIAPDTNHYEQHYPMVPRLLSTLKKMKLKNNFDALTESRKKDILKYLNHIKTEAILLKHIDNLCSKLAENQKNIRIP